MQRLKTAMRRLFAPLPLVLPSLLPSLLLPLGLLLSLLAPASAQETTPFEREYFGIFSQFGEGEKQENQGNYAAALHQYETALNRLEQLMRSHPQEQADVLALRRNVLRGSIARVRPLAAQNPGAAPAQAPTVQSPAADQIQRQINQLQRERDSLRQRLDQAQANFGRAADTARRNAAELRAELARLRDQVSAGRSSSNQVNEGLREEITTLREDLDQANARLAEAEARNTELSSELASSQEHIKSLELRTQQLTVERDRMIERAELATSEAGLTQLAQENTRLANEFAALQQRFDALQQKSEADQAEAAGLKLQIADLQSQVDTLRTENDSYKRQLQEAQANLDSTSEQLAAATASTDTDTAQRENRLLRAELARQMNANRRREQMRDILIEQLGELNADSDPIIASLDAMVSPTPETQRDREILQLLGRDSTPGFVADSSGGAAPDTAEAVADRLAGMDDLARTASEDFAAGRFERALHSMDIMLDIVPNDVPTLVNRGVVLLRLGRAAEAEDDFKKALAQRDENSFARTMLALSFLDQQNTERAIEELELARDFNPRDPRPHFYRGLIAQQQNDAQLAESEYEKAIELDPDYADAHFNLSSLLAHAEPMDRQRASEHYREATLLGARRDIELENLIGGL